MFKLFLVVLLSFSSISAFSSKCPTKEFVGYFEVESVQGCSNHQQVSVTEVINKIDNYYDSLDIRIFWSNGSFTPLYVDDRVSNRSYEKCLNKRRLKYYRWYPKTTAVNFWMGFSYNSGSYYAEFGPKCRYKLVKKN